MLAIIVPASISNDEPSYFHSFKIDLTETPASPRTLNTLLDNPFSSKSYTIEYYFSRNVITIVL